MTHKFFKDDIKKVFQLYFQAQGYQLETMKMNISYSELDSISFDVTHVQPKKTFIVPIGTLSREEAEQHLKEMITKYRQEITFAESELREIMIPESLDSEKRNEN